MHFLFIIYHNQGVSTDVGMRRLLNFLFQSFLTVEGVSVSAVDFLIFFSYSSLLQVSEGVLSGKRESEDVLILFSHNGSLQVRGSVQTGSQRTS